MCVSDEQGLFLAISQFWIGSGLVFIARRFGVLAGVCVSDQVCASFMCGMWHVHYPFLKERYIKEEKRSPPCLQYSNIEAHNRMSGTQHCHGLHHRQCRLCSSPAPSTSLSFVWLYLLFMCASCPIHMQFSARNDPLPTNNCDYAEVPISERSGWKQKDIISFISIDLSLKKGVKGANMSRITERCTFQSTPDRSPKEMQCRRTVGLL